MKIVRFFISCLIILLASACGFEPLHQTSSTSSDKKTQVMLPPISLPQAKSDSGFLLRSELQKYLTDQSGGYRLSWDYSTRLIGSSLDRDTYYTRYDSLYKLNWKLLDAKGKTATKGSSQINVPITIQRTGYPTLASQKDADKNAAQFLAKDVHARLMQYFRNKQ